MDTSYCNCKLTMRGHAGGGAPPPPPPAYHASGAAPAPVREAAAAVSTRTSLLSSRGAVVVRHGAVLVLLAEAVVWMLRSLQTAAASLIVKHPTTRNGRKVDRHGGRWCRQVCRQLCMVWHAGAPTKPPGGPLRQELKYAGWAFAPTKPDVQVGLTPGDRCDGLLSLLFQPAFSLLLNRRKPGAQGQRERGVGARG